MKKIGLLCLALVLALGALGVGYAAWTDTITIQGTVNTGSVDINVVDYSGTWIYKVPGDVANDEIWVHHGWATVPFEPPVGIPNKPAPFEVASAVALPGATDDSVLVTFVNAFPCQTLTADILIEYEGTIPVKVDAELTSVDPIDSPLAQYAEVHFYWSDVSGTQGTEITDVVQMHLNDYVLAVMSLHLPQDNTLMNLSCNFTAEITAIQWNMYGED